MTVPRVLVVTSGRVNASDSASNGLLLRNLFDDWPRDHVAQVYSSGDNGDEGFFGHYYRLGPPDRRFGGVFYRLKTRTQGDNVEVEGDEGRRDGPSGASAVPRRLGRRLLVDTGLYELIFRPRISSALRAWMDDFRPQIVLAQGYLLAFAWLPVMLGRLMRIPIAYYPTDDWATADYQADLRVSSGASLAVRRALASAERNLVARSSVRLAFNRYMQKEFERRHGVAFGVLMHGDDPSRFAGAPPPRVAQPNGCRIVAVGLFDRHRAPLLRDLDEACASLNASGVPASATAYVVNLSESRALHLAALRHVALRECPPHEELPALLRAADVLFLAERFDSSARAVARSVSSKAHLFMLSGRPTVVYADPITGVARYASDDGWAAVVDRRDPDLLKRTIARILADGTYRAQLLDAASRTAARNHDLPAIRAAFRGMLVTAVNAARGGRGPEPDVP